jgi:soluble cytochrome b562
MAKKQSNRTGFGEDPNLIGSRLNQHLKPPQRYLWLVKLRLSDFISGEMKIQKRVNEPARATPSGSDSSPTLEPPRSPQPTPPSSEKKPLRMSLIWLAALFLLGGMGTASLLWLVTLPPPPNCQQSNSQMLDMERLYCAQEAARSGELSKLVAGLDLLKQWSPEHPLYGEAQRLSQEWSTQVLEIARTRLKQGDLKGAESAISHIPKSTPVYADAQKALVRWRKYAHQGELVYAKAQEALKKRNWDQVSQRIVELAQFEQNYWQLEHGADALSQQLGIEKQAWQVLLRAQKVAASNNPGQLAAAVPLALQVPAQTYAAVEARQNLKQWSQKLVALGTQKWQRGDLTGAIAVLQLPAEITPTPEVDDLFKFGNAYKLAEFAVSKKWLPSLKQVWNLTEAIAALQQVKPNSPFYAQAQATLKAWQSQLQDLIQLQYASAAASLGQRSTFELAMAQAKQIPANHPRRVLAQTLIAYWDGETERLEDQPYLDHALALAGSGKIPDLQAAIVQASQIKLGRSLRGRAQDLIASWGLQIQTLEDQPILDQAWALAQQGSLEDAIAVAQRVRPGRALYRQTQTLVSEWRNQQIVKAQTAEDQPVLDRARALAETGDLAEAIDVASQIDPGRALYGQAQGAIATWRNELNPPAPMPESSEFSQPALEIPSPGASPQPDLRLAPAPSPTPPLELIPPTQSGSAPAPVGNEFPHPSPDSIPVPVEMSPSSGGYEPAPPNNSSPNNSSNPAGSGSRPAYEGYYDGRSTEPSQ